MASPHFYKLFSASYPRLLLCFVVVAVTFTLSNHIFDVHEFYIPAQRVSPTPAVEEEAQQPTPSLSTGSVSSNPPETTPGSFQIPCQSLRGLEDIFLIVRTGANEALDKLPIHFNTTLRCLPSSSYGIWSDLEETIEGHHVGNALDDVSPEVVQSHPDFDYYRRLQEKGRAAFSAEELAEWATAKNSASGRNSPGWKLDKWKFLPLAKKAYQQRPTAKWFIFTECDSFINWTSLLAWLSHHDPLTPYVGQKMVIGDVEFAYGGASFVVSNNAMKTVTEHYAADIHMYEDFTGHHWAGDCVLGKALKDVGVDFTQAWPTFSGDSPFERDFNSSVSGPDKSLWCYNAMTWHHMAPSAIRELSEFEEKWNIEVDPLSTEPDTMGISKQLSIALDPVAPRRCLPALFNAKNGLTIGTMG